jgi:hypothetical protein
VTQVRPILFCVKSPKVAKSGPTIDIEKRKNRLLKFCYVPATSAANNRLLFFLFLLQLFIVLMKQTRQAVRAIKQSIFLEVYGLTNVAAKAIFEKKLHRFNGSFEEKFQRVIL